MTRSHALRAAAAALLIALLLTSCNLQGEDMVTEIITPDTETVVETTQSSGDSETTSSIRVNNTFGVAVDTSGGFINPLTTDSELNIRTSKLIYDSLFRLSEDGKAEFSLCTAIEFAPDFLSATLTISRTASFHNGNAVTAGDAAYSIETAMGKNGSSPVYAARLSAITGVGYDDNAGTVSLTFSRPFGGIAAALEFPVIARDGDEAGVMSLGSGRYYIDPVVDGEGDTELYLQYYSDWSGYNGEKPILPRIDLVTVDGLDGLLRAYDNSNVDMAYKSLIDKNPIVYTGDAEERSVIGTDMLFVGFNRSRAPFDSADVRLAVSYLVDRDTVASGDMSGKLTPAYCPVQPDNALYDEKCDSLYAYSTSRAAALLTAAGYQNDGGYKLSKSELVILYCSDSAPQTALAAALSSSLNAFGIPAVTDGKAWSDYAAALSAGNYDLYAGITRPSPNYDYAYLLDDAKLFSTAVNSGETSALAEAAASASASASASSSASSSQSTQSVPPADAASGTQLPAETADIDPALAVINSIASADSTSDGYAEYVRARWRSLAELAPFVPVAFDNAIVYTRRGFASGITPTRYDIFYNIESWK